MPQAAEIDTRRATLKAEARAWFEALQDRIPAAFERLEQEAAARRKADELAAQAAALDAKRKVAEQLFDAITGLLGCEELAGEVSESTRVLIENANAVIAMATTTTTA